jgi:hypothetical protein
VELLIHGSYLPENLLVPHPDALIFLKVQSMRSIFAVRLSRSPMSGRLDHAIVTTKTGARHSY